MDGCLARFFVAPAAPSGAAADREGEAGSRAAARHGWLLGSVLRCASGAVRRRCESRGRGRKPSGCAPWMAAWLGSSSRQRRVPAPLRIARARQEAARCLQRVGWTCVCAAGCAAHCRPICDRPAYQVCSAAGRLKPYSGAALLPLRRLLRRELTQHVLQRVGWTRVCAAGCAAHCRPICDRPAYQVRSAARKKTARFPAPFLHSLAMTKAAVTPPSSPRADAARTAKCRRGGRTRVPSA